jgi:hypothetical protein
MEREVRKHLAEGVRPEVTRRHRKYNKTRLKRRASSSEAGERKPEASYKKCGGRHPPLPRVHDNSVNDLPAVSSRKPEAGSRKPKSGSRF